MSCITRDAEHHKTTRQVMKLRVAPVAAGWQEVLSANLNAKQRAMLNLALSFFTWRTLVRDAGLKTGAAVGAMVRAIDGASGL